MYGVPRVQFPSKLLASAEFRGYDTRLKTPHTIGADKKRGLDIH